MIVLRVGLTGGIGAGKSTVSTQLAALGAVIVDADVIAREVVEPGTPGLAALVDAFGTEILLPDGALDRPALAAEAFGSDESRATLNSIVHPLVRSRIVELVSGASEDAIVVQDVPLLVEGGMGHAFNLVVIVHVDEEERVRRLVGQRGMPESDARARIAAQATDAARRAAADVWLDNNGLPGALDEEIRALWAERLVPFERNLRCRTVVRGTLAPSAYRPEWTAQAERLIARMRGVCGESAVRIDHIGSTAVPGLEARDVVDVQITVPNLEVADTLAEPLAAAGFPRIDDITRDDPKPSYSVGGEADPALWAKRVHGGADPGRPVRIDLRVDGWPGQRFALVFRDWLRSESDVRTEYADIKRAASIRAQRHPEYPDAVEAYVDGKAPWFDTAYRRAWEWAERTGWSVD